MTTGGVRLNLENLGKGAPIQEALIDVRCILPRSDTLLTKIESLHQGLSTEFPVKENKIVQEFTFDAAQKALAARTTPMGWQFRNDTTKEIIQFRLDGFTYNKLYPYSDWATFIGQAKKYWAIYFRELNPEVQKIAVRFINRFEVPWPIGTDKAYLKRVEAPATDPEATSTLQGFIDRKVSRDVSGALVAVLQSVQDTPPEGQRGVYLLDIDIYKNGTFSPEDIWIQLENFREIKNSIFEKHVGNSAFEEFRVNRDS